MSDSRSTTTKSQILNSTACPDGNYLKMSTSIPTSNLSNLNSIRNIVIGNPLAKNEFVSDELLVSTIFDFQNTVSEENKAFQDASCTEDGSCARYSNIGLWAFIADVVGPPVGLTTNAARRTTRSPTRLELPLPNIYLPLFMSANSSTSILLPLCNS
ncbi:hypothetical protein D9613_012911 [Agrocybe pediades]|uniref:Uncharacterized protein n=1 Tax=Agrocybe pediades TaxID=84607 RepID=A0A8H4QSK5_9AGAR|nr:hypothetical protein D9613_012911 [Agrocybe pediades]